MQNNGKLSRRDDTVFALTIHQPWADFIVDGIKSIENRTWKTSYRGLMIVHASRSRWRFKHAPPSSHCQFGAIVGVCRLVHCIHANDAVLLPDVVALIERQRSYSLDASGPILWVLERSERIDPIPCSGSRGLWIPSPEIMTEVFKRMR